MSKYLYTKPLGSHKAGETIRFTITEQFTSDIEEISAGCSCQAQEWILLDSVLDDNNKVVGKIYSISGTITTPVKIRADGKDSKEYFKQLRVSYKDNEPDTYVKLEYVLQRNEEQEPLNENLKNEEQNQTKSITSTFSTRSQQYSRVVVRRESSGEDS